MDDLARRFIAGDESALRDLYRDYGRGIHTVAYRILNDRGLAEEGVQQTFLQAWRARARFDSSRAIGPWLYTIARRVAIDLYRRERRHQSEELGDRDVPFEDQSMESTWAAFQVRQALDQVPEDERAVLHATHFLGLTHEETADRLSIPVGTVKSRSYRAYRRMQQLLRHVQEQQP